MDCYPFFLIGLTLVAGVSFIDDVHSLPDSVRLVVQFSAMGLMIYQLLQGASEGMEGLGWWQYALTVVAALVVCVGATNIINFMDGINGITGGYALAVLIPLLLLNMNCHELPTNYSTNYFFDPSLVICAILSVVVFCLFNMRPKGKAKCFAGDVGSIGIAFILLFLLGNVVFKTGDVTYVVFLLLYSVDSILTIVHRIMLHENLGEAHRKHAYQLMCNELKMGHVKVSLLYAGLQLAVSLGFVYLCPNTVAAHWMYLFVASVVGAVAYVWFMRKYYHLHEEYLNSIK